MDIPGLLPPSLLAERLESVAYLYQRADAAVAGFVETSGVSCPHGCGSCCEGFVPDILPLEAAYLATFIAGTDRARAYAYAAAGLEARLREDGRLGCPLYADDRAYHCTAYEARPLICRMFAFSATRDKRGVPTFSVCKKGLSANGSRTATGDSLLEVFGVMPPVMSDMGSELASIDPDSSVDRKALPIALTEALSRVLFLVGMKDDDPLGNGPPINPPVPQAG
jgi:Fe-S-cluster containining protein